MGGLAEMVQKYPALKVFSSETEARYISGKETSLRLQQAERWFPSVPDDQKAGALHFQEMLRQVQPVVVDETIREGEELPFLEGVKVIPTPGHTPGHFSLYLKESKTLLAADAVVFQDGELENANPSFTLDLPQAVSSLNKLLELEMERIVCYHGGVVEDDIPHRLRHLISKYSGLNSGGFGNTNYQTQYAAPGQRAHSRKERLQSFGYKCWAAAGAEINAPAFPAATSYSIRRTLVGAENACSFRISGSPSSTSAVKQRLPRLGSYFKQKCLKNDGYSWAARGEGEPPLYPALAIFRFLS